MVQKDSTIMDNMISGKDIRSQAKIRGSQYQEIKINKSDINEYEEQGWKVLRKTKKQAVVGKPKTHDKAFEDQVWTLLCKMGFHFLNAPSFRLPYTEGGEVPPKQIDVLAADDETILVIECKSSDAMGRRQLQTQINELITVRNGSMSHLRKAFVGTHKIKYILATNNIILSDPDGKRLIEGQIQHFNQDDIHYYEQLVTRIGQAAKYQLLGRLFAGQEIPGMDSKIPAVRGKMGVHTYYSFSIEPEKLLKIGYIVHRVNISEEDEGYQRMIARNRLAQIEAFINNNGFFPNSVIVNIDTKGGDPLNCDKLSASHDSKITDPVVLHLPKKYHSAFIIDGQHRLYGYANTQWKSKNSIPVVAFENLPAEKQVELFVDINSKQKPVRPNLLNTIISGLFWNSDKPTIAVQGLKSRLLVDLGRKTDSPLYKRILLGDETKKSKACVTLEGVLTVGLNKTNFFPRHNSKGKLQSMGHLWIDPVKEGGSVDYTPMLKKAYVYFRDVFDCVKSNNEALWELGNAPGGFLSMNIGIQSIIRLSDDIIEFLKAKAGLDPATKTAEDLAARTIEYLEPVNKLFGGLDPHKVQLIRKKGASGAGVDNFVRELQKVVHDRFNEFTPTGLSQWIKDNSGRYNVLSKQFVEEIEFKIREAVFAELKNAHGDKWWKDGVPAEIQKTASNKRIDQKSDEPEHNFLDLMEYRGIIAANWKDTMKSIFMDPDLPNAKKDEQLKWFVRLNAVRNKVSHPGREKVTEDEFKAMVNLNEWLPSRVGMTPIHMEI